MKLRVDRLTEAPASFTFEGTPEWWRSANPDGAGLAGELTAPLAFELEAHRMGEDLLVEGRVAGAVELECSRCVARYRHALREPFRLVLEPAGGRVPADPEGAGALARDGLFLGDELESGWYRGDEIELGGFFFEIVSLALPVQPLCREDCPGLCPGCGVDLAKTECSCPDVRADSPFAVLAALKQGPTGRSN